MTHSRFFATLRRNVVMSQKAVLIADDDSADVVAIQRILKQARLVNPIRVARDGSEVIDYLEGRGEFSNRTEYPYPALLLLDLKMPKTSGIEVLQWIQTRRDVPNLAIIVFTAVMDFNEIRQAYQLGAHSFLMKPPLLEDLLNLLSGLRGLSVARSTDGNCLEFQEESVAGNQTADQRAV